LHDFAVLGSGIQSGQLKSFGTDGADKQSGDRECESRIVVSGERLIEEKEEGSGVQQD